MALVLVGFAVFLFWNIFLLMVAVQAPGFNSTSLERQKFQLLLATWIFNSTLVTADRFVSGKKIKISCHHNWHGIMWQT